MPENRIPYYDQMIKLEQNKVYQLNEYLPKLQGAPVNANSAMLYNVYFGEFTYSSYILSRAVMEILQPILFTELRTKQQLGYTVIGAFTFYRGAVGAMIKIQSSTKNPEQIEHHINELLKSIRAKKKFDE